MTDPFARLGAAMVRWRWPVIAIWLAVLVAVGALLAPRAARVLRGGGYIDPDSEAARAARILDEEFNASTTTSVAVVFRSTSDTVEAPAYHAALADAATRLQAVQGVRAIDGIVTTANPLLVSQDRRTTFFVVALAGDEQETQRRVPAIREAVKDVPVEHYVTGPPALNYDSEVISEEDLHRSELVTVPLVMVLLLVVFRTVLAAAMPLVVGACSVVLALGALGAAGSHWHLSIFALNVASMIGLGLGIDFSLIVVNRFREELATGRRTADAVAATMATAGRSITYSGVTVLLGMMVLTLTFNLMVIRSISLAVMLVAFTALLAGLTLLPALLGLLGPRIEWLRVMPRPKPRVAGHPGVWYRLSHAIMRHPWLWLGASLLILAAIAWPARRLQLYGTNPGLLPPRAESVKGVRVIDAAFGAPHLTPIDIVIQGEPGSAFTPEFLDVVQRLTDVALADPRNEEVFSLATLAQGAGLPRDQFRTLTPELVSAAPGGAQFAPRFVNLNGERNTAVITIFSRFPDYTEEHQGFIYDLRHDLRSGQIPNLPQLGRVQVLVGGNAASFVDFKDKLYGRFPLLVGGVMLLTFVVLLMFFQSIFLPIKAIFMNLATILATYGALVLIFQDGHGAGLLHFTPLGQIAEFTPVMLFVILFGLSTDYEVFMLSRVKEYYEETKDNEEAVAEGLEHTAGVITAAGLILVGTFGSFATADVLIVKEIGLGLAIGVLLDSTVVRVIMVPATMRLMGGLNWWMPGWLRRIVPELREGPAPAPALAVAAAPLPPPIAPPGTPLAAAPSADGGVTRPAPVAPARGATQSLRVARVSRLRSVGGWVGAETITLPRTYSLRIGRDPENELQLFDESISRRHARIDHQQGAFFITDLGSSNGVYVNGHRLIGHAVLRNGDLVEIGTMGTVKFIYELGTVPEPAVFSTTAPAGERA